MKMMNLLSWKWINGEREIPGRQKVVRWSSVSTLTSHAGLNPRSCTALSLLASFVSGKSRLVTSAKRELSMLNTKKESLLFAAGIFCSQKYLALKNPAY